MVVPAGTTSDPVGTVPADSVPGHRESLWGEERITNVLLSRAGGSG
jgi:hypothetical protein